MPPLVYEQALSLLYWPSMYVQVLRVYVLVLLCVCTGVVRAVVALCLG